MTEGMTHGDYFSYEFALHLQYSWLCGNVVLFSSLKTKQEEDNSNNRTANQTLMICPIYLHCMQSVGSLTQKHSSIKIKWLQLKKS